MTKCSRYPICAEKSAGLCAPRVASSEGRQLDACKDRLEEIRSQIAGGSYLNDRKMDVVVEALAERLGLTRSTTRQAG